MTQKRKILFIIDSYSYMSVEPYQKNLIPAINSCDLIQPEYIEKDSFLRTSQTFSFDGVYCALKMRDSVKFATTIRSKINSATHIVFQDFDPWVFYDYTSAHYGGYKKIVNSIENISFHIPNEFWSNYIRNDLGCIVHTSHIGPSFTRFENVKPHSERLFKHPVFYGSSYGVREYAFATLRAHGINVDWRKEKVPHAEFTNLLNDVKIWLHYEGVPQNVTSDYSMDNEVVRHWLWPKALEVLPYGPMLVRDYDSEADYYGISSMPSAFLYKNFTEAHNIINYLNGESQDKLDSLVRVTQEKIIHMRIWETFANNIWRMYDAR